MKTKTDIADMIARYVLAMVREHRYIEMTVRIEALVELLEMLREKGIDSFSEDIVEAMCFYQPKIMEGGNASDL